MRTALLICAATPLVAQTPLPPAPPNGTEFAIGIVRSLSPDDQARHAVEPVCVSAHARAAALL